MKELSSNFPSLHMNLYINAISIKKVEILSHEGALFYSNQLYKINYFVPMMGATYYLHHLFGLRGAVFFIYILCKD